MFLNDLQENRMTKLRRALTEVFDMDFNFDLPEEKLIKIQEKTLESLDNLKKEGVDSGDRNFQKLLLIAEGINVLLSEIAPTRTDNKKVKVKENAELDQAEVLLAAKQLADDLQGMAEDLAKMQVEDLMSITNAMKEEVGTAEADEFNTTAEAAIAEALEAIKTANDKVSNAVLKAQGEPVPSDMEMDVAPEPQGDMEVDIDDFEGADAADDMVDDSQEREMKEEVDPYLEALKKVKEAQSQGKINADVLKQALKAKA